MAAIFKQENGAYFRTPLGFVIISAFFFFSGYFFITYNIYGGTTNLNSLFSNLFPVVLFLIPVLTMRLFSEEKRLKIDLGLLTSPVSRKGIVLGKFLSAASIFLIGISSTLFDALLMPLYGKPDWYAVFGNFSGLFLLGAALIAICMFFSSLTESQVIAAVCGFVTGLFLMLMDSLALTANSAFEQGLLRAASFSSRYTPFTMGVFDWGNVIFFVSVCGYFLCLTVAVVDKNRWD